MSSDFLKSLAGRDYLVKEYCQNNQSLAEIAKNCDTYPNAVRRAMKYHNIKLRDKSEAQKVALQEGKQKHPTKGKKRPQAVKNKIGKALLENWKNLTDDEYAERCRISKEKWDNMTEQDKENLLKMAAEGVRKASKNGSSFEKYAFLGLLSEGYRVDFHAKLLLDKEMHVDIFLPDLNTVIEIDGPTHFLPIWGEERLAKTQASDATKNGLLLQYGYTVVRVKILKKVSKTKMGLLLKRILRVVKDIEIIKPTIVEERFMEVEY